MADTLTTLAAVGLGWVLSEIGNRLRNRTAAKAALGRALSELTEIRHYVQGISVVMAELRKRLSMPPQDALNAMVWFGHLLPPDATLPERYSKAVADIAGTHPLLAFRLRSKDQIPTVLSKLRALQLAESAVSAADIQIDDFITKELISALEDGMRELAFGHSLTTWWRVRALLRRPLTLPATYSEMLDARLGASQPLANQPLAPARPPFISQPPANVR